MPALSAVGRLIAALAAGEVMYVGRDPGRPDAGSGFSVRTVAAARSRGLVVKGVHEPLRGKRLLLTDRGRAAAPVPVSAPEAQP
jgi:hypothetical protein